MKRYVKKVLAITLAFIMVFTSGITGRTASIFAAVTQQNETSTEATLEKNAETGDEEGIPLVTEETDSGENVSEEGVTQESSEEAAEQKETVK